MAQLLRMPAVSADADSAVLLAWSVSENTEFASEDTLAEVETDKASVEIEAESAGIILKTLVTAGSEVEVGAPIALIGSIGEQVADIDALLSELGAGPAPAADAAVVKHEVPDEPAEHAEATVGETLTDEGASAPDIELPADGGVGSRPAANGSAGSANGSAAAIGDRVFISPLARRMARDAGLSVDQLVGTGPNNRIRRSDIDAAIASKGSTDAPVAASATPAAATKRVSVPAEAPAPSSPAFGKSRMQSGGFVDHPHSRLRKLIAARLTESKQMVPHFYLNGSIRVEKLLALRAELNEDSPVRISVNDLVIKAAAKAHTVVPAMNAIWTGEALRQFDHVDVSVAVASERGLVTPTLRAVETMSISAVSAAVKDFVQRAAAGKLKQEELEGGAFSVTNLGMFGVEQFAAIINPPQSAILAVGAARDEPVVHNGKLEIGSVMRVTLSVDHRAIDGEFAAEWLRSFISIVEKPLQILT